MIKKIILSFFILVFLFVPLMTFAFTPPVNGFFSYGGIVLAAWPCFNGIVILIGPPSPAIVIYQPPITLPRPWYVPFIPLKKDLGNAFLAGFCITAPHHGFWVPTAILLGSTLIP